MLHISETNLKAKIRRAIVYKFDANAATINPNTDNTMRVLKENDKEFTANINVNANIKKLLFTCLALSM